MNILSAKQQVKDAIEAYTAVDEEGRPLLDISRQRPIFIVGAPGIGKTAIMSQISEELGIGLVSYSMTHHTRQSALGLPYITHESYDGFEYEASEYTMSEIIASVYSYMKESGVTSGILFLDEINCVSETLYPSMLQFLQFKTFGRHKVPDGWIIVTAGNPPEYNKSVHEFDIVTLDRVKKVTVEPDFDAWKRYAVAKETHPAILTFLEIKRNNFYSVEASLDGKSFVTARSWDDLSDIMVAFERMSKVVDYDLISQYVQREPIAREFAAYYDLFNKYKDDYRIEEILAGTCSDEVRERASEAEFDERLSLVGLILDALCGKMKVLVDDTDLMVLLRDDLRSVKEAVEGGESDIATLLKEAREKKESRLEMAVAAKTMSRSKRTLAEREIAKLEEYVLDISSGDADSDGGMQQLSALFAQEVDTLKPRAEQIEEELVHAFDFFQEAFGDQQEILIFTTELTSRVSSARYIAQYGSPSYFSHNSDMILSERQRELLRRVENLEL